MACEKNTTSAGRAGQKAGITASSSKGAFMAGVTSGVFGLPARLKAKLRKRAKRSPKNDTVSPTKKTKLVKEPQKNGKASPAKKTRPVKEPQKNGKVSPAKKTRPVKGPQKNSKASPAKKTKQVKGQQKKGAVEPTKKAKKAKRGAGGPGPSQKNGGKGQSNGKATVTAGQAVNTPLPPLSPGPGQVDQAKTQPQKGTTAIYPQKPVSKKTRAARPQSQIQVASAFSGQELQNLSIQFRLDAAAARKQVQALKSGASRGIGHSDPRSADWARSDLKNYDFIGSQIGTESKRALGRIEVSSLSDNDLVDLWDFSRHEADQAVRFIDHLQVGESHLKGATANYLTDKYKLKGQFCAHLAAQLEPMITPEMIDSYERSS